MVCNAHPTLLIISYGGTFDNGDFVVGEVVEFVNQPVDLLVGGGDLALEGGFFIGRPGRG